MPDEAVRKQVDLWADSKRKVFDVDAEQLRHALPSLHRACGLVFWCVTPRNWEAAVDKLAELRIDSQGWKYKLRLVWVLDEADLPDLAVVSGMDFGHTDPMLVLPYGITARIDCDTREVSIPEAAVQSR